MEPHREVLVTFVIVLNQKLTLGEPGGGQTDHMIPRSCGYATNALLWRHIIGDGGEIGQRNKEIRAGMIQV